MSKHTVIYDGQFISFMLTRKKVKNINLRIRPDTTVVVSANRSVPLQHIEQMVIGKAPWILNGIEHLGKQQQASIKAEYRTGETVCLLGEYYPLQVLPADRKEKMIMNKESVLLYVKDEFNFNRKKQLVDRWYKKEATRIFHDSLDRNYPPVAVYGIKKPAVTIRTMKTRWGSCSVDKQKITLNTELVKFPKPCIDYIVLHELAHFRHRNHDKQFYGFLTELMPDWKEHRKYLKALPHLNRSGDQL